MDVFQMVRKKNATVFLDAKKNMSVRELKVIIAGITKVKPENQMLYKKEECMDTKKLLIKPEQPWEPQCC